MSKGARSWPVNEIDTAAFQGTARPIWAEIAKVAGADYAERVIALVTGE